MFKLLYTHFNAHLAPTKHRYVNKLAFPWNVIIRRLLGHPVYNTEQYVIKVKRIKLALDCCNKQIHLKMSQILPCPSNINKLAFHMFLIFCRDIFCSAILCRASDFKKTSVLRLRIMALSVFVTHLTQNCLIVFTLAVGPCYSILIHSNTELTDWLHEADSFLRS
jgi:hypothetical protein